MFSEGPIRSHESSAFTFNALNIYLTKKSEIHFDFFVSFEIKFVNYIKHYSPKYGFLSILQIFSQAIHQRMQFYGINLWSIVFLN